jgi:hypothetical protein
MVLTAPTPPADAPSVPLARRGLDVLVGCRLPDRAGVARAVVTVTHPALPLVDVTARGPGTWRCRFGGAGAADPVQVAGLLARLRQAGIPVQQVDGQVTLSPHVV